jgi:hypothetical protein
MKRKQMTKTTMYRKTVCTNCNYTQEDSVSYYLHAKAWNANHNVKACNELRKQKSLNAFTAMFDNVEDALASLTVIK